MALPSYSEAFKRLNEPYACFHHVTTTEHCMLPPRYLGSVKKGLAEILESKLKTYSDSLQGVIVAYNDVKLKSPVATVVTDHADIHLEIVVDYILFKIGSRLEATVTKSEYDFVSLLVHGVFNVTIFWRNKPKPDWAKTCSYGDKAIVKVKELRSERGMLAIIAKYSHSVDNASVTSSDTDVQAKKKKKKDKHKEKSRRADDENAVPDMSPPLDKVEEEPPEEQRVHKHKKKKDKHKEKKSKRHDEQTDNLPSLEEVAQDTGVLEESVEVRDFVSEDTAIEKPKKHKKKHKHKDKDRENPNIGSKEVVTEESQDVIITGHKRERKRKAECIVDDVQTVPDGLSSDVEIISHKKKKPKKEKKDKSDKHMRERETTLPGASNCLSDVNDALLSSAAGGVSDNLLVLTPDTARHAGAQNGEEDPDVQIVGHKKKKHKRDRRAKHDHNQNTDTCPLVNGLGVKMEAESPPAPPVTDNGTADPEDLADAAEAEVASISRKKKKKRKRDELEDSEARDVTRDVSFQFSSTPAAGAVLGVDVQRKKRHKHRHSLEESLSLSPVKTESPVLNMMTSQGTSQGSSRDSGISSEVSVGKKVKKKKHKDKHRDRTV